MAEFQRLCHRRAELILQRLDAGFLRSTQCYFGGGTRISMELDEYRESNDVDFLCSDVDGWRRLRRCVTNNSLGALFVDHPPLGREVRADNYGIRTYLEIGGDFVKFVIISSSQPRLRGVDVEGLPVTALCRTDVAAQKLMANASRGGDRSSHSKDLVDLAFIAQGWPAEHIVAGTEIAEREYGAWVFDGLRTALRLYVGDAAHRGAALSAMDMDLALWGPQMLAGLNVLNSMAGLPVDEREVAEAVDAVDGEPEGLGPS